MTKIFSSKEYLSEDLLQAGLHHLEAAEYLLKGSPELFDSAGYLAHMGIELMIKAWILHKTSKFPGIHSLSDLIDKLKELDPSLSFIKKEEETIAYLSKFEKLRYPNRTSPIEIGSEDINQINMIADTLWQKMPDELIDEYQKLPSNKKGGRVFMERPVHIPRDLELETGIKPLSVLLHIGNNRKVIMARKVVTEKCLLEWMNNELHKDEDLKDCRFTSVSKLVKEDDNGCNWNFHNLSCSGIPTSVCQKQATQIVSHAREIFNLE